MKHIPYRFLILALMICMLCAAVSFAGIIVSVTGNDTTGNGSIVNPFHTLSRASWTANPGDTIFMRGGIFISRQSINGNNGLSNQKIIVMPYNNEMVILDGSLSGINHYQGMMSVSRHYYTIRGINIINSPGYGIYFSGCNDLTIREFKIEGSYNCIIKGWGNNDTIENCIFTNNCLINENGALCLLGKGWPAGVEVGVDNTGTIPSRNLVLQNNKVSRTWGEGIYVIGCLDCIIENNEIYNNFSVNLGIGRSRKIIARNNYIYTSNDSLNRPDNNNRAYGISMANEMAAPTNGFFVDSITIADNIVAGCRAGIRFWLDPSNPSDSNAYSHVGIYYNVFSDIRERIINMDNIPVTSIQPSGCTFINNIAFPGTYSSILQNSTAWTITNNNWVNTLPSFASDPSNFIDDPLMINPVTGGNVNGFKLQPQSACAGKGIPIADVQTDFWGTTRDFIAPTVGVFEIDSNLTAITEIDRGKNEITIYPNPAFYNLTVKTPQKTTIEILNIEGKITKTIKSKSINTTIDLGNLSNGVYIIKAKSDKRIVTKKFMKE